MPAFTASTASPALFNRSVIYWRRMVRGNLVALHVLIGVLLSLLVIQPLLLVFRSRALRWQRRIVQWWFAGLTRILHLHIQVFGAITPNTAIFVANHISWIDVFVLGQLAPVDFISKAEVKHWPIIGWLAAAAGTLFIQRGNRDSMTQLQAQMQTRLQQQRSLCFFPEGTSTLGVSVKPFRRRLFQAALNTGVSIQAVALCYLQADGQADRIVPYVDDDTLLTNLWRLLAQAETQAQVHFCPLLERKSAETAAEMAYMTWQQVSQVLEDCY